MQVSGTVSELLGNQLGRDLSDVFDQTQWAEEEIAAAQQRWPGQADSLWHAFSVLAPSPVLNQIRPAEFVYRSHFRELLARVAGGRDTRPATDAELACACCYATLQIPPGTVATGLYARVWHRAFPGHGSAMTGIAENGHYEAIAGQQIDDLETTCRRTLTVTTRTLGDPECGGSHHGVPAPGCRYRARAAAA
jgi:hypothetical protein